MLDDCGWGRFLLDFCESVTLPAIFDGFLSQRDGATDFKQK